MLGKTPNTICTHLHTSYQCLVLISHYLRLFAKFKVYTDSDTSIQDNLFLPTGIKRKNQYSTSNLGRLPLMPNVNILTVRVHKPLKEKYQLYPWSAWIVEYKESSKRVKVEPMDLGTKSRLAEIKENDVLDQDFTHSGPRILSSVPWWPQLNESDLRITTRILLCFIQGSIASPRSSPHLL